MNEIKQLKRLGKKKFFSEKKEFPIEKVVIIAAAIIFLSGIFMFNENFLGIKNRITGRAEMDTSVIILSVTPSSCEFGLESGWNLISIPCTSNVTNITSVFSSVEDEVESIHEYTGGSADTWHAYNPDLPAWVVQDLSMINRKKGYWMNMNQGANYSLNASVATPNLMPLSNGWNLVGYPTLNSREISAALSSLQPNYNLTVIYAANNSTDKWKEYSWNPAVDSGQDLTNAVPYYGYWIYMTDTDTLVIDW